MEKKFPIKNLIISLLGIIVFFVALRAYIFKLSSHINQEKVILYNIEKLKGVILRKEDIILEIHNGLQNNYDGIEETLRKQVEILTILSRMKVNKSFDGKLVVLVEKYDKSVDTIDHFKRNNSILKNSLSGFTHVLEKSKEALSDRDSFLVSKFFVHLSNYFKNLSSEQDFETLIHGLSSKSILSHLRVIHKEITKSRVLLGVISRSGEIEILNRAEKELRGGMERRVDYLDFFKVASIILVCFGIFITYLIIRRIGYRKVELERENNKRARFFDLSKDLHFVINDSYEIIELNKQWEENLGISVSNYLNKPILEFISKKDKEGFLKYLANAHNSEKDSSYEGVWNNENEELYFFNWSLRFSKDENLFYGTVRDLTKEKEAEHSKNEFVSVVSHELRTPLTSMKASLSILVSDLKEDLSHDVLSMIEIALSSCERLVRLINDILDVEKIKSGKLNLIISSHEPGLLIKKTIDSNLGFSKEHDVRLVFRSNVHQNTQILVDEDAFIQVLTNLISNAIKYSPPQQEVIIQLSEKDEALIVSVIDHGEGIPENYKEKIFEKFLQVESSSTRKKGGTGLGLNIAKSLVEKMGGEIGFTSERYKKTMFYFSVPKDTGNGRQKYVG